MMYPCRYFFIIKFQLSGNCIMSVLYHLCSVLLDHSSQWCFTSSNRHILNMLLIFYSSLTQYMTMTGTCMFPSASALLSRLSYCRCAMFLSQFISQFQLSWFISGFCSFNQTFVQYSQSFCNSASSVAISLDRVLISFLRFRSSCRNMSSPIYLFLSSWSSSLASSYSISLVIDISY